jgi:chemotaxis protein MotB
MAQPPSPPPPPVGALAAPGAAPAEVPAHVKLSSRRRPRGVNRGDDHPQELDTEEWRLTYMDTITLLVAMFVLLLSIANFETPGASGDAKEGKETAPGAAPQTVIVPVPAPGISAHTFDLTSEQPVAEPAGRVFSGPLPQGVTRTILSDSVQLEISENVLFPAGSAELSTTGVTTLDQLVPLLKEGAFPISAEGHSDDRPISTERYPSNWELSSARASVVVRHFISRGVAEARLRAIGYAATRPVDRSDTDQARAHNRRVDLRLETGPPDRH